MITFRLPAFTAEHVIFASSPLLEAVLSLHVLIEPRHHPLQHPWIRQMRRLSPALKREIALFRITYGSSLPAPLFPTQEASSSFADEIARFKATCATLATPVLRFELMKSLYDHKPERYDEVGEKEQVLTRAAETGLEVLNVAQLAFDDSEQFVERFVRLLASYWEEAFEVEWQRIKGALDDQLQQARQTIVAEGLYSFLQGFWPELRTDPDETCFWLQRDYECEVQLEEEQPVLLIPSVYCWPHMRVNCDPPWMPGLVFPVQSLLQSAQTTPPASDVVRVLRALADETRLQVLHFIAERPRSTQELAPLVGLSEAALSKHLRLLTESSILQTERKGYYVLYSLSPDHMADMLWHVQHYLNAGSINSLF